MNSSSSSCSNNNNKGNNGKLRIDKLSAAYVWSIKNFKICNDDHCAINSGINYYKSPIFFLNHDNKLKCRIFCSTVDPFDGSTKLVSFMVKFVGMDLDVEDNTRVFLLDKLNKKVSMKPFKNKIGITYWQISKDLIIQTSNNLFINNSLRVLCQVKLTFEKSNPKYGIKTFQVYNNENQQQLTTDLQNLFESQEFSDVTFLTDGKEIKVHKSILVARNEAFSSMFRSDMKESNKNLVEITDISYEVLMEIFRFIYTGKVMNIIEIAKDLMVAAEKYGIEGLKLICEETLMESLDVNSVSDILILADTHNAKNLKSYAINYIILNLKEVIQTTSYKSAKLSKPGVIADILDVMGT